MDTRSSVNDVAKHAGDKIIELSVQYADRLQKWSDSESRPDNLSVNECLGFINKENSGEPINLVLDLTVPASSGEATLRIWAITSQENDRHVVLFNNIQLTFQVGLGLAGALAVKGSAFSRDDIKALLHDPQTHLARLVISDGSGVDAATGQPVGSRYDLTPVEPQGDQMRDHEQNLSLTSEQISQALEPVLNNFAKIVQ